MSESEPNQEELKRDGIDSLLKLEDNSNDFVSVGWSGVLAEYSVLTWLEPTSSRLLIEFEPTSCRAFCLDLARANFQSSSMHTSNGVRANF
jgi:hypothetical protein